MRPILRRSTVSQVCRERNFARFDDDNACPQRRIGIEEGHGLVVGHSCAGYSSARSTASAEAAILFDAKQNLKAWPDAALDSSRRGIIRRGAQTQERPDKLFEGVQANHLCDGASRFVLFQFEGAL